MMCKYLKKVYLCKEKENARVCMCKKNKNYMRIVRGGRKLCSDCRYKESE